MWFRHLSVLASRVLPLGPAGRIGVCAAHQAPERAGPCRVPPVWLVRRLSDSGAEDRSGRAAPRRLPGSVSARRRGPRHPPRVILDIHEEQQLAERGEPEPEPEPLWDPLEAWGRQRGRTGVFDVEELVAVLEEEGMEDVCVLRLPEDHAYVAHMVVVTARSYQHMLATALFLKRLYKRKRWPSDPVPRIEGKNSREWIAMDFVNIALHMFDGGTRAVYDVDGLWAVGPQFDELSQWEEQPDLLSEAADPLAEFRPQQPAADSDAHVGRGKM